MDITTKQQLLEETIQLLAQVRYLTAQEIFILESALNNKDISDNDLQTIHTSLNEYKLEQDTAYADFQEEVKKALVEYTQNILPNKS